MSNLIIWNWSSWPSCMVILQLFSQNISTLSHCLVRPAAGPLSSKIPKIWPGQQAWIDYWPAGCKCRMPPGRWWHCSRFLLDVGMVWSEPGQGSDGQTGYKLSPRNFSSFLFPLPLVPSLCSHDERWLSGGQAPCVVPRPPHFLRPDDKQFWGIQSPPSFSQSSLHLDDLSKNLGGQFFILPSSKNLKPNKINWLWLSKCICLIDTR